MGPLGDFPALREQIHQVFPGGDLKLTDRLTWSLGLGYGFTGTSNRLIYKSRLELSFGRKHDQDATNAGAP